MQKKRSQFLKTGIAWQGKPLSEKKILVLVKKMLISLLRVPWYKFAFGSAVQTQNVELMHQKCARFG